MTWVETIATMRDFAGIFEAIAVVVSLLYLSRQLRENAKIAKGNAFQAAISAFATIEARISQDPNVARIYHLGYNSLDDLSVEEQLRFHEIVASLFNLYESLYYQYQQDLLDEILWLTRCRNLREDLSRPGIRAWWNLKRHLYNPDFRTYVETQIDKQDTEGCAPL